MMLPNELHVHIQRQTHVCPKTTPKKHISCTLEVKQMSHSHLSTSDALIYLIYLFEIEKVIRHSSKMYSLFLS